MFPPFFAILKFFTTQKLNSYLWKTLISVIFTQTFPDFWDHTQAVIFGSLSFLCYRGILCKGSNFPATLPRPIPAALSFKIPICDKDTEKGQMEVCALATHFVLRLLFAVPKSIGSHNLFIHAGRCTASLPNWYVKWNNACHKSWDTYTIFSLEATADALPNIDKRQ